MMTTMTLVIDHLLYTMIDDLLQVMRDNAVNMR